MAEAARGAGPRLPGRSPTTAPRLTVAHGLNEERLRAQLECVGRAQRRAGALPHPHRHGGRHPRGRLARPRRRPAWASSTWWWPASTPSSRWSRPHMTRRMLRGHREPAHRHPRPLHRSHHHRTRAAAVRLRRRGGVLRLRPDRDGGRDQLPARAPGPARRTCCARPSTPGAASPSTPTPTRRASSGGWAAAAATRCRPRCPSNAWSTARARRTWWPGRQRTGRRHDPSRRAAGGAHAGEAEPRAAP